MEKLIGCGEAGAKGHIDVVAQGGTGPVSRLWNSKKQHLI